MRAAFIYVRAFGQLRFHSQRLSRGDGRRQCGIRPRRHKVIHAVRKIVIAERRIVVHLFAAARRHDDRARRDRNRAVCRFDRIVCRDLRSVRPHRDGNDGMRAAFIHVRAFGQLRSDFQRLSRDNGRVQSGVRPRRDEIVFAACKVVRAERHAVVHLFPARRRHDDRTRRDRERAAIVKDAVIPRGNGRAVRVIYFDHKRVGYAGDVSVLPVQYVCDIDELRRP